MRILKWFGVFAGGVVAIAVLAVAAWNMLDDTPTPAAARNVQGQFDASRLLVLADGDMAATAYADGQLFPIADARDLLIRLDQPGGAAARSDAELPNTVMGWPGAMTVSPDGRYAYVVESRGSVDRSIEGFADLYAGMPVGTRMTVLDTELMETVASFEVCERPNSADIAPSGDWVLVVCGDASGELAIVPLERGLPSEGVNDVRHFDLDLPDVALVARDEALTYGVVHPSGQAAGVIASNRGVGLVRFTLDADGIPVAAEAEDLTMEGDLLSMARWTPDGGHLLVADTGWGPAPTDALFNGPGSVFSFALSPDDETRGVVSRAVVGKSPEAIELNRTGDLLVAVNMERTAIPGGILALAPGRGASSLSLVAVEPGSGMLNVLHEPVGFRGVLPEDAVFDADGDHLAVVIYQDHDAPRSNGWVEFFGIEGSGADRQVVPTGRRIDLPRGTHDLFVID